MSEADEYFLGYRAAEQERLQRQAQELEQEARWLLDQIGLPAGARAVEIGCGPRGCLDLLSERVGAAGEVVGVERSDDAVQLARKFIADNKLANVRVLHADARHSGLPRGTFDLTTARLVLVNIPHPEEVVSEMAALLRRGGVVALHEVDWIANVCDPPLPAWDRLNNLMIAFATKNGNDLYIGRRLPRMLYEVGLVDVRVQPLVHVPPVGHPRRMLLLDLVENLRERVLGEKLIGEAELDESMASARRHLEDPHTLQIFSLYFQAGGRKPEHQP
jgi:SAM-dependent methyltransferase